MRRRQVLALLGVGMTEGCLRLTEDTPTSTTSPTRIGSPTESPTAPPSPTEQPAPTPVETDSPTETASPTETPTPDIVSQVDGLSVTGVTHELADSHEAALGEVPFQAAWTDENTTAGEVTSSRSWRVADGRAYGEWTNQGPVKVLLAEEAYWREELDAVVTYGNHRNGLQLRRITRTGFVRTLLKGGDWAAPTLIDDAPPGRFRIVAVGVADPEPLVEEFADGSGSVAGFTADGQVDGRGIIHKLSVDLEMVTGDGSSQQWRVDLQWDPSPDLSVSTPSWHPTAKAQAPEVSARLTDDRQFVELQFDEGNDMVGPFNLTLFDGEAGRNEAGTGIDRRIEAGQTIYLYHEGDRSLQLSYGSRPSGASPVTLDASLYGLWAYRNPDGLEYFFIGDV